MLACVLCFLGQDVVFKCLGENILQNAFEGYNACIFAYGQTGESQSEGEVFPPSKGGVFWLEALSTALVALFQEKCLLTLIRNLLTLIRNVFLFCNIRYEVGRMRSKTLSLLATLTSHTSDYNLWRDRDRP